MMALPAENWPVYVREVEEQNYLDLLIETVAYYQELAFEYPTTMVYRRMLEDAQNNLREAEKRYLMENAH